MGKDVDVHALNVYCARACPASPSGLVAEYFGFGRVQLKSVRSHCAHDVVKHRGEARQIEYLKDEILTRVVGFGWGEYKVRSS